MFQASRFGVQTHRCRSRQCPLGHGAVCRLIGLEQISMTVGAATRVSGINGRTTREQRNSWRWPAVVSQRAEHGVGVVPVAAVAESAGAIAAQVIAMRRDGAATICVRIVCDNAVLQRRCAVVKDTASRISANGAVIHCQAPRTIDDGATRSAIVNGSGSLAIDRKSTRLNSSHT